MISTGNSGISELAGWTNFYVIVGSSAGALIGLQFVVMALIADVPRSGDGGDAGSAFATPNIVHFGTSLLISAVMCAPWRSVDPSAILLAMLGFCGALYSLIVARRMRTQTVYHPVLEDWMFHGVLPFVAYSTLTISSYLARIHPYSPMFGIGGAALLLLFVGIHNAWDAAAYHVFVTRHRRDDAAR